MRFKCVPVLLSLLSTSAWAQDPYAAADTQQILESCRQIHERAILATEYYAFAHGCKVIADTAVVNGAVSAHYGPVRDCALKLGLSGSWSQDEIASRQQDAIRRGLAQSFQPNTCNYWHNNPQAVSTVRDYACSVTPYCTR